MLLKAAFLASHSLLLEVVFLVELPSLLLFFLDLEAELPEPSFDFLADRIYAWLESQLLVFLIDEGAAEASWRDLNKSMLVVDKFVRQRVELLDEVVYSPHARDLFPHLDRAATSHRVNLLQLRAKLVPSLQVFDFFSKFCRLVDHLIHALLRTVPVGVIHQLEEDVDDSTFDLVAISERVENVPELEKEFFFTRLSLLFCNLEGALTCPG